ncbi:hypothetical protein GGQ74_001416 [Desulfobaculum xiamenense]|uniref:ATP-grasp domain-containing protein n=1 Tax=Desulfobaculum xiamenense TaxID=995050 RepID=A0A846QG52_9BACT|nr:ATP-grasp domain-containing protein [Desulfobaculum xiamenense]NJB67776.1 hypothetical protein [Desulfobaculum xiamenense]
MILLEKPYVSEFLKDSIRQHGHCVCDTPRAQQMLAGSGIETVDAQECIRRIRDGELPRVYCNSENAIDWVAEHLAFTGLPEKIAMFKNKARCRDLLRGENPDFFYRAVPFDELGAVNPTELPLPVIVKPAVGFYSLGVHKAETPEEWHEAVAAIRAEVDDIRSMYPLQVLDLSEFIIEEVIEGEEYAVDVYFDDAGDPVILDILHHVFSSGKDVSDRLYVTSADIMRQWLPILEKWFGRIGSLAGLRNFPMHAELRVREDGEIVPIEINPMRFAGWCVTDIASHAWGIDTYDFYLSGKRPDWKSILAEREGYVWANIIGDLPAGVKGEDVLDVDYEAFAGRFEEPLELRPINWLEYPLFAFIHVRTRADNVAELDAILHADMGEFLTLR